jgi:diguanylate cyclase (GGDEF)-like protein/PAS domain S-box-containing protein
MSKMKDEGKTKEQLINELVSLRQRIPELGKSETEPKRPEEALPNSLKESQQRQTDSALLEGTRAVLRYREFEDAARSIFESCKNLIGAAAGHVALLTKDGRENEVPFLESGGLPFTVDSTLPRPIRGLRGEAYRTGKVIYHNGLSNSEWMRFTGEGDVSLDNVLFAPLVIEKEAVGLLGLANKLTENDARLATAFGDLAAVALLNSRALESLHNSEGRFRSVVETANDAIISADSRGKIVFWNNAAETLFGYSADEAVGKPLALIMPERSRGAHRKGLKRVVSTGESNIIGKTVEMTGLRKGGSEFPIELSLANWKTKEGIFFTGIVRDITERKRAEATIRQLAYHDSLTGLPNRMLFNDRLTMELAHAHRNRQKFAVMILDLDYFKDVNDTLGHGVGDQLLQAVGRRLKDLLRKNDTVARMGGDEFLLLLLEIARVEAVAKIAQKILKAVREPFVIDGHRLEITTSIGIATYPKDGKDGDALMTHADNAMYRAKKEGRDSYHLYRLTKEIVRSASSPPSPSF